MICSRCGASVLNSSKFCGDCGSALAWRCSGCGSEQPADKRFCTNCGTTREAVSNLLHASAGSGAERRQLTIMIVDLVGSTALGERLDPEDLREVIAKLQD